MSSHTWGHFLSAIALSLSRDMFLRYMWTFNSASLKEGDGQYGQLRFLDRPSSLYSVMRCLIPPFARLDWRSCAIGYSIEIINFSIIPIRCFDPHSHFPSVWRGRLLFSICAPRSVRVRCWAFADVCFAFTRLGISPILNFCLFNGIIDPVVFSSAL